MKAALTQMNIRWEQPTENRMICERLVQTASTAGCDWILFPEMTLTGFTMQPERFREPVEKSPTKAFFHELSIRHSISIAYGYIAFCNGHNENHLVFEHNGQIVAEYAKIHPFSYGEESRHYTAGSQVCICQAGTAKTPVMMSGVICYDLRFPELFQIVSKQAEVILVSANWPESRIDHWHTLLKARAIENQCFILGVNRTGEGDGIRYRHSSVAYDPYGIRLTPDSEAELLLVDLQPDTAKRYRQEFPLRSDRKEAFYYQEYGKFL